MADVFISYSRKDGPLAQRLNQALADRGKDIWIDLEDIPPSAEWMQRIRAAIDGSSTIVVLLSDHSVSSAICGEEIAHAASRQKRLVPVSLGLASDAAVPEPLRRLNWIIAGGEDAFEAMVSRIVETLDTDLAHVDAHTRILVRAVEWEARGRDPSFLLRGSDLREAEQWLAQSGGKTPSATDLHTQYIHGSRARQGRRLRVLAYSSMIALAISIVLAVFAFLKREDAVVQAQSAMIENQRATTALKSAVSSARQMLGAKLAVQAEFLPATGPKTLPRAALLAIEGLRRDSSSDADRAARHILAILPRTRSLIHLDNSDVARSMRTTPDGGIVSVLTGSGAVIVFDASTGVKLTTIRDREARGPGIFSPDGKWLISPGRATQIYDTATWKPIPEVLPDTSSAAFSPKGDRLMLITAEGMSVLETATWRRLASISCAIPPTMVAEYGIGRSIVAAIPEDRRSNAPAMLAVYTVPGGEQARVTRCEGVGEWLAVSPDGRHAVRAAFDDKPAQLWDTKESRIAISLIPLSRNCPVRAMFSADSSTLALVALDECVHIIDTATLFERLIIPQVEALGAIALSSDGARIATGGYDDTARVWNTHDGHELVRQTHGDYVSAVGLSPDGSTMLSGMNMSNDGLGIFVDIVVDGSEDGIIPHGKLDFPRVSWSEDGSQIRIAHDTGELTIAWPAGQITGRTSKPASDYEGRQRMYREILAHNTAEFDRWAANTGPVKPDLGITLDREYHEYIAASPDNRYLAVPTPAFRAEVFDAQERGACILAVTHEANTPGVVAFSPDSALFVSTSIDPIRHGCLLQAHELPGRQQRIHLPISTFGIAGIAFSPDGSRLAACCDDGYTRIYLLRREDLIAELSHRLRRNLTANEWQRYLGAAPYEPTVPGLPIPVEMQGMIGAFESNPGAYTAPAESSAK